MGLTALRDAIQTSVVRDTTIARRRSVRVGNFQHLNRPRDHAASVTRSRSSGGGAPPPCPVRRSVALTNPARQCARTNALKYHAGVQNREVTPDWRWRPPPPAQCPSTGRPRARDSSPERTPSTKPNSPTTAPRLGDEHSRPHTQRWGAARCPARPTAEPPPGHVEMTTARWSHSAYALNPSRQPMLPAPRLKPACGAPDGNDTKTAATPRTQPRPRHPGHPQAPADTNDTPGLDELGQRIAIAAKASAR
jgi:hypothetical protein